MIITFICSLCFSKFLTSKSSISVSISRSCTSSIIKYLTPVKCRSFNFSRKSSEARKKVDWKISWLHSICDNGRSHVNDSRVTAQTSFKAYLVTDQTLANTAPFWTHLTFRAFYFQSSGTEIKNQKRKEQQKRTKNVIKNQKSTANTCLTCSETVVAAIRLGCVT